MTTERILSEDNRILYSARTSSGLATIVSSVLPVRPDRVRPPHSPFSPPSGISTPCSLLHQGLPFGHSFCRECTFSSICTVPSFASFKSVFICHLLSSYLIFSLKFVLFKHLVFFLSTNIIYHMFEYFLSRAKIHERQGILGSSPMHP